MLGIIVLQHCLPYCNENVTISLCLWQRTAFVIVQYKDGSTFNGELDELLKKIDLMIVQAKAHLLKAQDMMKTMLTRVYMT